MAPRAGHQTRGALIRSGWLARFSVRFYTVVVAHFLALWPFSDSAAGSLQYCSTSPALTATEQDRILQFSAIVKAELEASGQRLAIVSRSGLDLSYFGQRYSHAGISLLGSQNTPWSVRQLYFDCAEQKPRIFDQGLPGFVMGSDDAHKGFVSIVFVPEPQATRLEHAAKDNALSLQLLAAHYSANAYAFSTQYQNCNQWLAELLAAAWADLPMGTDLRSNAQAWLAGQNYLPTVFNIVWRPLLWVSAFSNLVHTDDHPAPDLAALQLRVSMPASLEAFVKATLPQSRRVELCRTLTHVVVRRDGPPLQDDCVPGDGDQLIRLDAG